MWVAKLSEVLAETARDFWRDTFLHRGSRKDRSCPTVFLCQQEDAFLAHLLTEGTAL